MAHSCVSTFFTEAKKDRICVTAEESAAVYRDIIMIHGVDLSVDVPSPLLLHKSGTKYVLSLDLHHHSTVSNTTLKPIISPFHDISTDLVTARSPDFGEQSNCITLL